MRNSPEESKTREIIARTINPPNAPAGTYTAERSEETTIMIGGELEPRGNAVWDVYVTVRGEKDLWSSGYTRGGVFGYLRGMGGDLELAPFEMSGARRAELLLEKEARNAGELSDFALEEDRKLDAELATREREATTITVPPITGATIVACRAMTDDELASEGWSGGDAHGSPVVVLTLDNELQIFASMDPEGNAPGALFGSYRGSGITIAVENGR